MANNNLSEVNIVNDYYAEYLRHVQLYQNCKRDSIFIRYYNVSVKNSDFNDITKATFDRFKNNGIRYDIYDYTPIKYINPISETLQYQPEISGYRLDSNSRIVTYSIVNPHINDLVSFAYHPHNSEQIFRVKSFSSNIVSQLNGINTYELDLEYAPMINVDTIKIVKGNEFVYSVPLERYITSEKYSSVIKWIESIVTLINTEFKFNPYYELFQWMDPNNLSNLPANIEVYPISINTILHQILTSTINFKGYFDEFPRPYGIKAYFNSDYSSGTEIENNQYSVVYDYNNSLNPAQLLAIPIKTISDTIPINTGVIYSNIAKYYIMN